MGSFFGIGAAFAGWLCEKIPRLVVMQTGLIGLAVSCILMGPSYILHLPNKVDLIIIGISANAFFGGFVYVPITPEIIHVVTENLKQKWTIKMSVEGMSQSEISNEVVRKSEMLQEGLADKASALQ